MSAWPLMRLDECCQIVSGATPSTSERTYWDGGDICWITPKDLSDLQGPLIHHTPRKITAAGLASCGASVLPAGSVLFSSRAPIGHVAITAVEMTTNQGFKSMIPERGLLRADYLYHWLRSHRSYLEGLGNGATFKEVSKAVVSRVMLPIPPMSEQRRIAAILDQADALRAKRREAVRKSQQLAQAAFIAAFGDPGNNPEGWPVELMSELVCAGDTINYGVVQPGEDCADGIPLVRVGDLMGGRVQHRNLKRISKEIEAGYRRSRLQGDEILVSCVGSIGQVALATPAEKGFNIARAVARIRVSDRVKRVFIAEYLNTAHVQHYFIKELRTVSQPTLNIKQIGETKVFVPPIADQERFCAQIAGLSKVKQNLNASMLAYDTLFASLQHRAFRGEL